MRLPSALGVAAPSIALYDIHDAGSWSDDKQQPGSMVELEPEHTFEASNSQMTQGTVTMQQLH